MSSNNFFCHSTAIEEVDTVVEGMFEKNNMQAFHLLYYSGKNVILFVAQKTKQNCDSCFLQKLESNPQPEQVSRKDERNDC